MEDAFRSAFESRDMEFAADLMEAHIIKFGEQLNPNAGLRWIARLPSDILIQRTLLRLFQCFFLLMLTELSEIKEIIMMIERLGNTALGRYTEEQRVLCKDFIILLKSMLQIFNINQLEEIAQFKELDKKIAPQHHFFLRGIEMVSGITLLAKGELSSSEASFERAYGLMNGYEIPRKKIHIANAKALIARYQGRLHQAEAIITGAMQYLKCKEFSNTSAPFLLHRHLGHIFYLQNRLTKARECATLAVKFCEQSGLIEELTAGNELCLLLHLAGEEREQTAKYIQQMRIYSIKLGIPQIAACADAWSARIAVEQGGVAPAKLWLQRRNLKMDESFSLIYAMECLTQARVYHALGQYSDAARLLEALQRRCLKRTLLELALQVDILHSAALYAMNRQKKAKALLKKALAFSETEGYVRPFVNYAELITPILISITDELSNESISAHLKKISAACNISLGPPKVPLKARNAGTDKLTLREIEILGWLSKGFGDKEIAKKAAISANTVKFHVRKILAKLNAQSRIQASLKAQKLGILK